MLCLGIQQKTAWGRYGYFCTFYHEKEYFIYICRRNGLLACKWRCRTYVMRWVIAWAEVVYSGAYSEEQNLFSPLSIECVEKLEWRKSHIWRFDCVGEWVFPVSQMGFFWMWSLCVPAAFSLRHRSRNYRESINIWNWCISLIK